MMLKLYAVNLDIKMLLDHFKGSMFLLGVEGYGWMRSSAREMKGE